MARGEEALLQRPAAFVAAPGRAELRYLLAWLPVALLTLKIKYSIVSLLAIRVISRSLGRVGDEDLLLLEKLSLYSSDLWLAFLLAPVIWLLALRLSPPGLRPWLTATVNLLLFLLLFATWQCFLQTGRYYSLATLLDSLWWSWHHPEFVGQYVPLSASVQLGIAAAAIIGMSVWARVREIRDRRTRAGAVDNRVLAAYAILIVLLALVPFLASNLPQTPYHRSVLAAAAAAMSAQGEDALPLDEYVDLSTEKLMERYRGMTRAPEPAQAAHYFGRAQGYNVLLFVLETAPSRVLPVTGNLGDLPSMEQLRPRSFVAGQHHSTYPYTDRAWFSILTSLYPSSLMRPAMELPGMKFPGMMRSLASEGYATKVYYTPFQNDKSMFRSLGVEDQHHQQRTARDGGEGGEDVSFKLADDEATIAVVRKDLAAWAREGRNFCIAVGPQIGHAPWPELPGTDSHSSLAERGRAAVRVQDGWLGQLMQDLRQQGRLERTLILVVGDHGVRTRQEDPGFEGGMIDEYSFHVPFLLFAPGVLSRPQEIGWLTSHIDISPTVLDLLGIDKGRELEQGSPLWDERIRARVTFFFANHYLGADGYVDQGRSFMKNHVAATVYESSDLRFGPDDLVPAGSKEHAAVTERIRNMVALQEVLGRKAGEEATRDLKATSRDDKHRGTKNAKATVSDGRPEPIWSAAAAYSSAACPAHD